MAKRGKGPKSYSSSYTTYYASSAYVSKTPSTYTQYISGYGSDYGSYPRSDYGSYPGSDYGPYPRSDYGYNYEPDYGSNYGSDYGPGYGSEYGSDYGSNYGSDYGSGYGSGYGPNSGPNEGPDNGPNSGPDKGPDNGPSGNDPKNQSTAYSDYDRGALNPNKQSANNFSCNICCCPPGNSNLVPLVTMTPPSPPAPTYRYQYVECSPSCVGLRTMCPPVSGENGRKSLLSSCCPVQNPMTSRNSAYLALAADIMSNIMKRQIMYTLCCLDGVAPTGIDPRLFEDFCKRYNPVKLTPPGQIEKE